MAKPTLFWTLKPKWWTGGFEVMRVTTGKPHRFYGSTADGETTHVKPGQCRGRFETQEEAEERIEDVKAIQAAFADTHAILQAARNAAEGAEREAISAAVNGSRIDVSQVRPEPDQFFERAKAQGAGHCRKLVRFGNG